MSELPQAPSSSETGPNPPDLPQDLDSLLAEVGEERRQIFALVRNFLDEIEQAAGWRSLYNPPEQDSEMFAIGENLVRAVADIPNRVDHLLQSLRADCDEATREALEDAEFYLQGIHGMVAGELARLEKKLAEHRASASEKPSSTKDRAFLCEIAGDLKGKYASALMGATAAIVAEGVYNALDIEPLLFAEKAEEHRRNERLAEVLELLVDSVARFDLELPFQEVLGRWQELERTDPYALADLTLLCGQIAQLLKIENRRALYSGDFHEIRGRERDLSRRLAELDSLQRSTWEPSDAPNKDQATFDLMRRLLLEIVAMIDIDLLESYTGASTVQQLRMLGTVVARRQVETGSSHADEPLPEVDALAAELQTLPAIFAKEDLKTFLAMLRGAVSRRASLRASSVLESGSEPASEAAAPSDATPEEAPIPIEILPAIDEDAPEAEIISTDMAPAAIVIGQSPDQPAPAAEPLEEGAAMNRLRGILNDLHSPENPKWRSVLMLKRLLGRHERVPRAMLKQTEPHVLEMLAILLPELTRLEPLQLVPAGSAERLKAGCAALIAAQTGTQSSTEVLALLATAEEQINAISSVVQDFLISQLS